MFGEIDGLIFAVIVFHGLALGWLIKAAANFILLYANERKGVDLVIAGVFLGLTLDRVWSIWGAVAVYSGAVEAWPLGQVAILWAWRLAGLILLNGLFLLFDIVFFRHK